VGGLGDDVHDQVVDAGVRELLAQRDQERGLQMREMDRSIIHMPITGVEADKVKGWWQVSVYVNDSTHPYVTGKKDRRFFGALEKAIRAAYRATH